MGWGEARTPRNPWGFRQLTGQSCWKWKKLIEEKGLQLPSSQMRPRPRPHRPSGSWEAGTWGYSHTISCVSGTQACHLSGPPARPRHQKEDCALLRLSQGLCSGESLPRWVSGAPSLCDAPSVSHLPACPGLPSRMERVGPGGGGYLGHRLRPSLRRRSREEEPERCGAARVPRRRRVQALPASGSGPAGPRLLKAPASAPAPPLARRPDAPQARAVGPRPEATGSSADPGGRDRSGVGFFLRRAGGPDLGRLAAPSGVAAGRRRRGGRESLGQEEGAGRAARAEGAARGSSRHRPPR